MSIASHQRKWGERNLRQKAPHLRPRRRQSPVRKGATGSDLHFRKALVTVESSGSSYRRERRTSSKGRMVGADISGHTGGCVRGRLKSSQRRLKGLTEHPLPNSPVPSLSPGWTSQRSERP